MNQPLRVTTGSLRTTERNPYHRYQDPETGETIACIHQDGTARSYRASTPVQPGPLRATIAEATEDANRILQARGYPPVSIPAA